MSTLAAVVVSTGNRVTVVSVQDPGWRDLAKREAQRVAEERRAELIRWQQERRSSAAHARMRLEGDISLYAQTPSAAESLMSCPVAPAEGKRSVFDILFRERTDGRLVTGSSDGASTGTGGRRGERSAALWPGVLTPVVEPPVSGPDYAAAHPDRLALTDWGAQPKRGATALGATHTLPLFPSASDAQGRRGIAQVRNRSARSGEVRIVAVDDSGREYGPLDLFMEANGTVEFDSGDLENGRPDKGLYGATGPGVGDWRLKLSSDLEIETLSYVRTWDGALMPMHDVVASDGNRYRVPFFHPASQWDQESRLRLINPGNESAFVTITGVDSQGHSPGTGVSVAIPAGASVTYTSAQLEAGNGVGLRGWLGEGIGGWRLVVASEQPIQVMNLLSSPAGHLSNLSTTPSNDRQGVHGVPLVPSASDPTGRLGLVRVINRTDTAGEVRIKAFDDTQWDYVPLVLSLRAGEAVQFDSNDLEQGNPGQGLAGRTGPGEGDWRLELSSDLDIEVLSYVRSLDGLLTAMHDVAPREGTQYRVASFNPRSGPEQESRLRLVNPGSRAAQVTIFAADGLGASPGHEVSMTIAAGASRTFTAAELAFGEGSGLAGSMGDAMFERPLLVESGQPLMVMSLMFGPSGRLTNLSTGPVRGVPVLSSFIGLVSDGDDTETIEEMFGSEVSPIVQAKCVVCHVQEGVSGATRLVFVPATNADHEALNLQVFRDFLEEVEDGANVILNKVQGVAHGGGVQAAAGTVDFTNLQRFQTRLGEAVASMSITPETLFDGVTMETPRQTLRRAALVFAGRTPTDAEYAAVQGGDEAALRTTIRGLMTGPGFHEFLIRASNDRLLTDRDVDREIISRSGNFVDLTNKLYRLIAETGDPENAPEAWDWMGKAQYGAGRAPLELIAHVVENDLPYTEILTADYIMANPQAAEAYGASTVFDDPGDVHEFKPSEIVSYYRDDESKKKVVAFDKFSIIHVTDPGDLITDYPHAGILNTTNFLLRYPTTATNRNRARSRWTYYHFLGLDIEKSAPRTTNPTALADTNNPTMNNAACTVCHTVLDPVAGAFQNYGDEGLYRDQWGGMDSLDKFYKDDPPGGRDATVEAGSWWSREVVSVTVELAAGNNELALSSWTLLDGPDTWQTLGLDYLTIHDSQGNRIERQEFEYLDKANYRSVYGQECVQDYWNGAALRLWNRCILFVPFDAPAAGNYRIDVAAWIDGQGKNAVGSPANLRVWASAPYRDGDTWYRDMRSPGFDGQLAPNPDNSVQWLAEQIVADPRFAEAAVKFWWPPIMGSEVAEPPEDENDADFEGLLVASNAQAAEVTRLADGFRSGFHEGPAYNVKDLLVEIVLSQWFRAEAVSEDDPVRRTGLAGAGARRLLTPEELAHKTLALTGFQWGRVRGRNYRRPHESQVNGLTDPRSGGYRLLYGGIDSDGVTERARELTSVMAGVAQAHALQSSYPIVMRELYLLPNEQRKLFADFDISITPTFEFGESFEIENQFWTHTGLLSVSGRLKAGTPTVSLAFPNDFYQDEPRQDRNVRLDRIDVRNAAGRRVHRVELETLEAISDCNRPVGDHFALHCSGSLTVPITVPVDGEYTIEVMARADQGGDELPILEIALNSDTENSVGADRIKSKLVELYDKLHGLSVTTDSAEVQDAYALFVEVWESKRGVSGDHFLWNDEQIHVDWGRDHYFLHGIDDESWREEFDENGNELGWDWDRIEAFFHSVNLSDPQAVARTWAVVLAYLMMDYRYLYL